MKLRKIISFSVAAMFAITANAQTSDSKTGTARAGIIAPINVENIQNMNWGMMVTSPETHDFPNEIEMTMNSSGVINGQALGSHAGGTVTPVKIRVSGAPGAFVMLPTAFATVQNQNGAGSMFIDIDQFPEYFNIPADGEVVMTSGGRLSGWGLEPGTYTGSYTITVNYDSDTDYWQ